MRRSTLCKIALAATPVVGGLGAYVVHQVVAQPAIVNLPGAKCVDETWNYWGGTRIPGPEQETGICRGSVVNGSYHVDTEVVASVGEGANGPFAKITVNDHQLDKTSYIYLWDDSRVLGPQNKNVQGSANGVTCELAHRGDIDQTNGWSYKVRVACFEDP